MSMPRTRRVAVASFGNRNRTTNNNRRKQTTSLNYSSLTRLINAQNARRNEQIRNRITPIIITTNQPNTQNLSRVNIRNRLNNMQNSRRSKFSKANLFAANNRNNVQDSQPTHVKAFERLTTLNSNSNQPIKLLWLSGKTGAQRYDILSKCHEAVRIKKFKLEYVPAAGANTNGQITVGIDLRPNNDRTSDEVAALAPNFSNAVFTPGQMIFDQAMITKCFRAKDATITTVAGGATNLDAPFAIYVHVDSQIGVAGTLWVGYEAEFSSFTSPGGSGGGGAFAEQKVVSQSNVNETNMVDQAKKTVVDQNDTSTTPLVQPADTIVARDPETDITTHQDNFTVDQHVQPGTDLTVATIAPAAFHARNYAKFADFGVPKISVKYADGTPVPPDRLQIKPLDSSSVYVTNYNSQNYGFDLFGAVLSVLKPLAKPLITTVSNILGVDEIMYDSNGEEIAIPTSTITNCMTVGDKLSIDLAGEPGFTNKSFREQTVSFKVIIPNVEAGTEWRDNVNTAQRRLNDGYMAELEWTNETDWCGNMFDSEWSKDYPGIAPFPIVDPNKLVFNVTTFPFIKNVRPSLDPRVHTEPGTEFKQMAPAYEQVPSYFDTRVRAGDRVQITQEWLIPAADIDGHSAGVMSAVSYQEDKFEYYALTKEKLWVKADCKMTFPPKNEYHQWGSGVITSVVTVPEDDVLCLGLFAAARYLDGIPDDLKLRVTTSGTTLTRFRYTISFRPTNTIQEIPTNEQLNYDLKQYKSQKKSNDANLLKTNYNLVNKNKFPKKVSFAKPISKPIELKSEKLPYNRNLNPIILENIFSKIQEIVPTEIEELDFPSMLKLRAKALQWLDEKCNYYTKVFDIPEEELGEFEDEALKCLEPHLEAIRLIEP